MLIDIHSVSPQMGSVRGGTLVTLTGTGFEVDALSEISVDIDGIPCRVRLIHNVNMVQNNVFITHINLCNDVSVFISRYTIISATRA